MANEGQIKVDLQAQVNEAQVRGELDKLSKAAQKGGTQSRVNLASQVKGLAPTSMEKEEASGREKERRAKIERNRRNAAMDLKDEVDEASRRNRAAALWKQRASKREAAETKTDVEQASRNNRAAALWRQRAAGREAAATAQQAGASSVRRGMVGAAIGAAGGGPAAGAIGGLLMAAGPAAVAIAAVTAAVVLLISAIKGAIEAFQRAAALYAKSITSGAGVGMTQKKGQLADILGVSENDIFQFGAAIEYLNDKIKVSSSVLASNVPALAAVVFESRALGSSIEALGSQLAVGMAGPIQDAIAGIRLFIDTLLQTDVIKGIGVALGAVFTVLGKIMELLLIGVNVIVLAFQALADGLTWLAVQVNNFLASISGGLLATKIDDTGLFEGTKKGFEGLTKQVDNFWNGASNKKVPEPQAQMKQMPASSWEKMGLVIGGGGGTNYAQQTAKNTEKSNSLLGKIANALANPKNSGDKLSFTSVPSTP